MTHAYREEDATAAVATWGERWGEVLARRVHTSRLLGADPSLVLHGGGNTSAKAVATEVDGTSVDVIHVKGSGWDLATIEPQGFATCRLAPLRRLAALDALDDESMVRALRAQMLDPASPTPSVEALLHAILPGRFVDHTHADAALVVLDQPDAAPLARTVWGPGFLFVPYVMPGFALTRAVAAALAEHDRASGAPLHGLALERHGLFTWGDTAAESHGRMDAAVRAAHRWRTARPAAPAASIAALAADSDARAQRIAPRLRGALARAGHGAFVMEWRTEPAILALLEHADARDITARGTVTPDHVIRTKPWPMWLDVAPGASDATITQACEAAVGAFAERYEAYVVRGAARSARVVRRLDGAPRIVLVPGCGALTLGRHIAEARVAGDVFVRAAQVMLDAEAAGRYTPVGEYDLFDVEYWSLEQAKLAKGATPGPLADRVALVTGAARGIGRATAERLLALGAHVVISDVVADALEDTRAALATAHGPRVAAATMDVGDDDSVAAAVARVVRLFGGLDLVVSNAGTAPQGLLHTEAGQRALAGSLDVNLMGHERVARAATDVLLAQRTGGCLLFNASKSGVNPGPEFGPYAVPKAGLLALMRQYAVDLGAHGIRSNAVNADRVRTDLFGGGVLEQRARARGLSPDEYFQQNLLRRETTAADVAAAFAWLAQAGATTGCVITVDGGNAAAFLR